MSQIATNGFVLITDEKQLRLADNLDPYVRAEILEASPEVGEDPSATATS
jgi:hypothetical protein